MGSADHDFGLVGLGVMGRNFILNVADNGFSAIGLDLDQEKVDSLVQEAGNRKVTATTDKEQFISALSTPRKIMLLVPAGAPVDAVIADLKPLLDKGDIIIDGGNSFFTDTDRRFEDLKKEGIHFFGAGVSGGAKGARKGPSIMPGGDKEAYAHIQPIFEAASAKVNGEPCVAHLGKGSAGNYVKMVHNGIEYAMMQMISEVYHLLRNGLGLSNDGLRLIFEDWNKTTLESFLVEITGEIFAQKDEFSEGELVDQILDKAKQKGTGKWTSQNAMDLGVPIPAVDVSVSMRQISAFRDQRLKAEEIYEIDFDPLELTVDEMKKALHLCFMLAYAQGFVQLRTASAEYGYDLNMETIAKIWRGGCIIRSAMLEDFRKAFDESPNIENILLSDVLIDQVKSELPELRKVVSSALGAGYPVPALSASLNYILAYRTGRLPLNLIQAQRDHFGSHTYERLDKEGIFHTEWE